MAKNLILGPILAGLAQMWTHKIYLWVLPLLVVGFCSKLSLYAISSGKRPNFVLNFAMFAPNLGTNFSFCGFYLH